MTRAARAFLERERSRLRAVYRRLRGGGSPARLGWSVGLGLFVGCLPLYGLHLPLCLLICLPLRLDAVLAYLAANISNPIVAPFLIFLEVEIGSYLLSGGPVAFDVAAARRVGIAGFIAQAALGSVVLGAVLGLGAGFAAARLARRSAGESPLEAAIRRTRARYRDAPRGDRYYVASKLGLDPVLESIAALGPLGRVLDAGSGRGQLGLCLLELGRASELSGFDFDARKVSVAQTAARGDARFEVGDLTTWPFASADTILLVDVLHYLPSAAQDAVLARAAAALGPGGRLLVREVDSRSRARAFVTRVFERLATAVGYNRAASELGFRPLEELVNALSAAGLACRVESASPGLPVSNAVLVAERPPSAAQASSNSLQNSSS